MTTPAGSVLDLVERIQQRGPGPLSLFTAQTDEEFEKAFDVWLEKAVIGLEGSKVKFKDLDEDGLSSVLALALTMPGIDVAREKNSNGHVDLTIEVSFSSPIRRKLGEAKIYDGSAYHIKGLKQLLGRYTTGREGRGLLIEYVRDPDIAGLMKKVRNKMDEDLPEQQKGKAMDHSIKWSFISIHGHSCGEDLEVGHIGCNLYVCDSQDKQ
jgi:hypothetical protein